MVVIYKHVVPFIVNEVSRGELKFSKSCRRSLLRMMSVVRSLGELFHCIIRGEGDSFSSTDTTEAEATIRVGLRRELAAVILRKG